MTYWPGVTPPAVVSTLKSFAKQADQIRAFHVFAQLWFWRLSSPQTYDDTFKPESTWDQRWFVKQAWLRFSRHATLRASGVKILRSNCNHLCLCACVNVLHKKGPPMHWLPLSVLPVEAEDRLFKHRLRLQRFKEKCDIPSSGRHFFFRQDFPPSVADGLRSGALKTNMFLEEGTQNKVWRSGWK